MEFYLDILFSFLTLTVLEIILGIDNLIFLAIITQKLPKDQQKKGRQLGLTLAWVTRLLLLASAVWITKLTTPLFTLFGFSFSGRDFFLLAGGMFLLAKATQEVHLEIDPVTNKTELGLKSHHFAMVVTQIALLDIIFSLDSVLTAIGITQYYWLMAAAITVSIIVMVFASEPLSLFVEKHPTIKMLALSFLMLIGMVLIAESFHFHIPRGYLYFAMSFSLFIEFLNMLRRKRSLKSKFKKTP